MAVTYVQRTIGGVAKDAIVVTGTGATEEIILKEALFAEDLPVMDAIDAETGADFRAKMAVHTTKSGIKADVLYANLVHLTDVLIAKASKNALTKDIPATLVDFENRITTLEP